MSVYIFVCCLFLISQRMLLKLQVNSLNSDQISPYGEQSDSGQFCLKGLQNITADDPGWLSPGQ